uniref:Uncharacterized protein n=1 Tax=Pelusios castaneus TaxID=367368 RepID=A0A8C8SGK8_9SAUR
MITLRVFQRYGQPPFLRGLDLSGSTLVLSRGAPHAKPDAPAPGKKEDSEAKSECLYQQSHSYVEMNQRLQKACRLLKEKCEELKEAGATLEQNIMDENLMPASQMASSNLTWLE